MEFMKQNLDFSNEIWILSTICILGHCDVTKHQQEDASCISVAMVIRSMGLRIMCRLRLEMYNKNRGKNEGHNFEADLKI